MLSLPFLMNNVLLIERTWRSAVANIESLAVGSCSTCPIKDVEQLILRLHITHRLPCAS